MRRLALACSALLLLLGGCGDDERKFAPQEFVDEANARGAAIRLEDVLTRNEEDVEVYSVRFTEAATGVTGEGRIGSAVHGNGTLLALADAAAAEDEYERCLPAPSLTCFRAANVVLRFEDLEPADQARLVSALQALETVDAG